MFTGLVDDIGVIDRVASTDAGRELEIRCGYDDLQVGESVALSGVCMTVLAPQRGGFTCAAFSPTLDVTTIGSWAAGRRVNLERALRPSDRLGGHFVQGHVDGIGRIENVDDEGDALILDLAVPESISDLMVERGSIAIDGVSLTIQALIEGRSERRSFRLDKVTPVVRVGLIEHTRTHTTLGSLKAGDKVHVEADMLAKHVRKLLSPHLTNDA
jgi:riboflavin synthase